VDKNTVAHFVRLTPTKRISFFALIPAPPVPSQNYSCFGDYGPRTSSSSVPNAAESSASSSYHTPGASVTKLSFFFFVKARLHWQSLLRKLLEIAHFKGSLLLACTCLGQRNTIVFFFLVEVGPGPRPRT